MGTIANGFSRLTHDCYVTNITVEERGDGLTIIRFYTKKIDINIIKKRIRSLCGEYLGFIEDTDYGTICRVAMTLTDQQAVQLWQHGCTHVEGGQSKSGFSFRDIKKIFARPKEGTTTIKWTDGSTTTVKLRSDEDIWDIEDAVNACIIKKLWPNHSGYQHLIKEHLVVQEPKEKK